MQTTDEQERETIRTYDTYAESWAKGDRHHDRKAVGYDGVITQLKKLLPEGDVLEVGAGGGWDGKLLTDAGYGYLGTDASQGMVQAARKAHPGLLFEQLSVYDLPQLQRKFDGFWACAVLLHVPKKRMDEALRAIASVTRPGGIGLISMKDGDHEELEQREKSGRLEKRLFAYWQKVDLEQTLQRNGFEVEWYEYFPYDERSKWHRFIVRKI